MNNKKHETFCDYDLTNLLTKLGFNWKEYFVAHDINEHFHWEIPLHIAQKWLREVKGIHICVKADAASINCKYFVTVIISDTKWGNVQDENKKTILFNTYELAQGAGIKKATEIILEKDDM